MEEEKWAKAIEDFEVALEWDGVHVPSLEQLGIAYFQTDELCKAYIQLKKALKEDSKTKEREAKDAPRYLAKTTTNPCKE